MNPQNKNGDSESPQFDGFGGPNISYENYGELEPATQASAPVAPQTINVVNANGIVSGQKMVEYVWKQIAYWGIAVSIVLLIGLIVSVVLVGMANTDKAKVIAEREATERNLNGLYDVLAVSTQEEAIQALTKESEYINGGDIQKIDALLMNKYGDYVLDYENSNINFVKINNAFKIVSVGVKQSKGTVRALLYARISTGEWKLGGFNSENTANPCADSTDEEKEAFANIISCEESKSGSTEQRNSKSESDEDDENDSEDGDADEDTDEDADEDTDKDADDEDAENADKEKKTE